MHFCLKLRCISCDLDKCNYTSLIVFKWCTGSNIGISPPLLVLISTEFIFGFKSLISLFVVIDYFESLNISSSHSDSANLAWNLVVTNTG